MKCCQMSHVRTGLCFGPNHQNFQLSPCAQPPLFNVQSRAGSLANCMRHVAIDPGRRTPAKAEMKIDAMQKSFVHLLSPMRSSNPGCGNGR